jgi:superfamily II DNA or RNA helicase
MLQFAALKLDEIREDLPDAGGLVIAPNIEMAEYMASLIEMIEGEPAVVVHSQQGGSSTKIKAFRRGSARWLVSVAMVSEGVDISRLRLLVYLPYATTELAFRQAVGRVVRSAGNDDFSRAYIVMPCLEKFDAFARRIEEEIPPSAAPEQSRRTSKICPVCESECERNATECAFCGYEFPVSPSRMKDCSECGASNLLSADACCECGASFLSTFQISLREALRDGAIVRGIEVSEKDVREGEAIAGVVRREALRSGDERIVELIKKLPEESWGRLKAIING